MMTELPGNVLLADKFPNNIFCGFSLGSPGLARLARGLGHDGGLVGVKGGLKVGMMTELPGDIFLADEFPDIFCGFSFVAPALRGSRSASAATTAWWASRPASRWT